MSNLNHINPEKYTMLLVDDYIVVYNTGDQSSAIKIPISNIVKKFYDTDETVGQQAALLNPVTRYKTRNSRKWIIERPPLDIGGFLLPWTYYCIVFNEDKTMVEKVFIFFRNFVSSVEVEPLFRYPCPWVDQETFEVHQEILDKINKKLDNKSISDKIDRVISKIIDWEVADDFLFANQNLPEEFLQYVPEGGFTYSSYINFTTQLDLEKLLYLSFKPLPASIVDGDESKPLTFKDIISYLDNDGIATDSLLDFIASSL